MTLQDGGKDEIERALEGLTKASHKLAEVLYQKAAAPPPGAEPGAGEGPGGKSDGGDVIDAEVVDKK